MIRIVASSSEVTWAAPMRGQAPVGWKSRGRSRGLNADLAVGCLDEDIEDCQRAQGHLAIVTSAWDALRGSKSAAGPVRESVVARCARAGSRDAARLLARGGHGGSDSLALPAQVRARRRCPRPLLATPGEGSHGGSRGLAQAVMGGTRTRPPWAARLRPPIASWFPVAGSLPAVAGSRCDSECLGVPVAPPPASGWRFHSGRSVSGASNVRGPLLKLHSRG
jgi:hypothetical protein